MDLPHRTLLAVIPSTKSQTSPLWEDKSPCPFGRRVVTEIRKVSLAIASCPCGYRRVLLVVYILCLPCLDCTLRLVDDHIYRHGVRRFITIALRNVRSWTKGLPHRCLISSAFYVSAEAVGQTASLRHQADICFPRHSARSIWIPRQGTSPPCARAVTECSTGKILPYEEGAPPTWRWVQIGARLTGLSSDGQ